MTGLRSLNNFFASVQFQNPQLAERISPDVETVALYAIAATGDNTPGQEAADRLRRAAWDMPAIHARVLESALLDLGYE